MTELTITRDLAAKVLSVVDQGLSRGLGNRKRGDVQGGMCVEAAVCYALGLEHGDDPGCVSGPLRALKIRLNDNGWSSKAARAKGLRRLALAQLGSKGHLDDKEFVRRVVDHAIRVTVPGALRIAASIQKDEKHKAALCEAANRCEKEGTREAAQSAQAIARSAAAAAYDAAAYAVGDAGAKKSTRDKSLADYAEAIVQILIDMKAPGCQWLDLTEVA